MWSHGLDLTNDNFVFSSAFNLASMTCQLVELGIIESIFNYFYLQLEHQMCKIEATKAGVSKAQLNSE